MFDNGRMSRTLLTRIAAVLIGFAILGFAVWAVQDVVAGPDDRELGPVVVNTHEPSPSPTAKPEQTVPPAEPSPTAPAPVDPAPPVVVEDPDWDDDDWDDWDDDDWDDDDDDWDDDDDD